MLVIDGSQGEGGGQVLRTALGLSLVTGTPFRIEGIRAGRERPGLLRQHLTGVLAAAEVGEAEIEGAELGSSALAFRPGRVRPGAYRFSVGTAGSVGLVLQALLPALLVAEGAFELEIEGGTHASHAPPFDFLSLAFVPLLRRMGASVEVELLRAGFHPAGGGRVRATIRGGGLRPLELVEPGALLKRRARALVANLPASIGERELALVRRRLLDEGEEGRVEEVESAGPGNALLIEIEHEHATEVVSAFGARGRTAEAVAESACGEARAFLGACVPVGEHLCDQLLIPLALAGGGAFRTMQPTLHARTNADVIRLFLDRRIDFREERAGAWRCVVG